MVLARWYGTTLWLGLMLSLSGGRAAAAAERSGESATGVADLNVRVTSGAAMGSALVRALVQIAPHEDNRRLRIEIESADFFRSTDIQLDGEGATRNHQVTWPSVPPGEYVLIAAVFGADREHQRLIRRTRFSILTSQP
jgi:hypothetical protein